VDLDRAKFPAYLKNIPCDWGGKFFQDLSKEKQEEFEQQILTVAEIKTTDPNEVKDLFVRLQAGSALNAQERRDAWPGNFTHFILRVGGKPAITRYPGHRFFPEVLKMKPRLDRGKTRQLAAQMYVLFDIWRSSDGCRLCDISAEPLNKFYYDHLMFDEKSPLAKDFWQLLTKLATVIPVEKLSRLKGHDAIHALLLADTLSRHYEATWDKKFGRALATFLSGLANGKKAASEGNYSEYWSEYGQWTNTSAADGDKILKRHMFYQRKMLEAMSPILPKDPNRGFGEIERSVLFYRQNRICQVCDQEINFDDLEVHHVKPHAQGGPTEIENGAIVHPQCHPKSESAVEAFAAKWLEKKTIRERNTFEH